MKRMLSILLMLMLVPYAALAEEEDEPVTPMYELTMAHGFRFGGALSYMQLWDTNYLNFLKTHCNSITATNEMKAYSLLVCAACHLLCNFFGCVKNKTFDLFFNIIGKLVAFP